MRLTDAVREEAVLIKLDIINEVVNRTGITKTKAEMAVETVFESMPLVRSIVRDSAAGNFKFSSIVAGIVKSPAFQMNMKPIATSLNKSSDQPAEKKGN